jgi:hypothetical protein
MSNNISIIFLFYFRGKYVWMVVETRIPAVSIWQTFITYSCIKYTCSQVVVRPWLKTFGSPWQFPLLLYITLDDGNEIVCSLPIGLTIGTDWLWRGRSKYNTITTTGQARTFDNVLISEEQEQFVDAKGVDRSHSGQKDRQWSTKHNNKIKIEQHEPHQKIGWTRVLQKGIKQFLLHMWHKSCNSYH